MSISNAKGLNKKTYSFYIGKMFNGLNEKEDEDKVSFSFLWVVNQVYHVHFNQKSRKLQKKQQCLTKNSSLMACSHCMAMGHGHVWETGPVKSFQSPPPPPTSTPWVAYEIRNFCFQSPPPRAYWVWIQCPPPLVIVNQIVFLVTIANCKF